MILVRAFFFMYHSPMNFFILTDMANYHAMIHLAHVSAYRGLFTLVAWRLSLATPRWGGALSERFRIENLKGVMDLPFQSILGITFCHRRFGIG
jgi:hypothetical protein